MIKKQGWVNADVNAWFQKVRFVPELFAPRRPEVDVDWRARRFQMPAHPQGHAIAGASWEGFAVEQVAAQLPPDAQLSFYRTAAGAELDLVIEHRSRKVAVEIKFSSPPEPTKGFWQALNDMQIDRAFVIALVSRRYPLAEGVEVLPLLELVALRLFIY